MSKEFKNTFRGDVNSIQIQQDTLNSVQIQNNHNGFDYDEASNIFTKIEKSLNQIAISESERSEIIQLLDIIREDVSERKDPNKIKRTFSHIADILKGASGEAIGAGIVLLITKLCGG